LPVEVVEGGCYTNQGFPFALIFDFRLEA